MGPPGLPEPPRRAAAAAAQGAALVLLNERLQIHGPRVATPTTSWSQRGSSHNLPRHLSLWHSFENRVVVIGSYSRAKKSANKNFRHLTSPNPHPLLLVDASCDDSTVSGHYQVSRTREACRGLGMCFRF